jgi:Type VI secretion system effector, Hcp
MKLTSKSVCALMLAAAFFAGPAAAAKKGATPKPFVKLEDIKGESQDHKHKDEIQVRKSGHDAPDLAKPTGPLKTH